ncbi:phage major capsid protein, HK97 family [Paenibacillus algicola]|uniref:Phage major capsid protein, HK97 family n=1 Tax=Paenibacillus algicola TaxID=2565926 RepID=A0A4P8XKN8_9BACL|nr:phage major capsid protein [Paenibacillus algicola]QCT03297.1 phage major capsid protein, HK97 family [Paenibacillus algicola]
MKNLIELRKKLAAKKEEMRSMIESAQGEKRGFTDEEETKFTAMEEEARSLESEIKLEERSQQLAMSSGGTKRTPEDPQHETEFRSLGELVKTYRENPNDERLKEYRELAMKSNNSGGIFVPPQFSAQLFEVSPESAIVRPRALVIPAEDSAPDANITFPALDQGAGSNMYGGVEVNWIGEGDEKPETNAKFKDLNLAPHEVAGHIVVTDKLLRNAPAINQIVTRLFRGAIAAAEDDAFLYGNGVAKPMGAINSPAAVTVPRQVAGTITYTDIVGMLAKAKLGGNLVWAASQSILPQLLTMKDDAGNLIFHPNIANAMTGTLLGYPIRFSENSPVLGAAGDLVLTDFGYYVIKDGAGIFIQASEHPLFKQNKTIIKAFWNVDGKPWLNGPLTLKNGYEVSPFVKLGTPQG